MKLVGLDWRSKGACVGKSRLYDDALEGNGQGARAASAQFIAAFCDGCPVRAECLAYGAETESTGIFGGQQLMFGRTAEQRRARRAKRNPQVPSTPELAA